MGAYEDEALASRAAPDDDPADLDAEETGPAPLGPNLLDQLRAVRTEAARDFHYHVIVPGYSGRIAVRCKPIGSRTSSALAARLSKSRSPEAAFEMSADTLIAACEEVVVRDDWQDEWQSLGSLNGGEPVGIGNELVELLTLEPAQGGRAREVVRSLFGLAPAPELALGTAVGEYLTWASAADEEVDEVFSGNSPGAGS
jgi:hypothetical protein